MFEEALNDRQKLFVEFYVGEARGVASRAAELAGYSPAGCRQQGAELMRNPKVRAAVEERLDEIALSAERMLALLARQAEGDPTLFVDCWSQDPYGRPKFDMAKARELGLVGLIREVVPGRAGDRLVLHDPTRAIELLARLRGMFVEKHQITGPVDWDNMTTEQIARVAKTGKL